jgi:hypothetical protein
MPNPNKNIRFVSSVGFCGSGINTPHGGNTCASRADQTKGILRAVRQAHRLDASIRVFPSEASCLLALDEESELPRQPHMVFELGGRGQESSSESVLQKRVSEGI